jgi:polysaccharide chain length determinant protein (PEP-CTERM system associated)
MPIPPEETIPLSDLVTLAAQEGKRKILGLTAIFAVVAIGTLTIGVLMPKRWDTSTLIVADARDILKPLLEGRAVPTTTSDHTPVVIQEMVSPQILREVLSFGGWTRKPVSAVEEDRLLTTLRQRIKIDQKEDTIKISYYDNNPQRAYRVTNKLAEIFIRESLAFKERQSKEAFDFIARRVKEYAGKLTEIHGQLLAYYRGEGSRAGAAAVAPRAPVASPNLDAPVDGEAVHARVRVSPEELDALRAEEATLTAQLGHKRGEQAPAESRQLEQQYRAKLVQLQADLDRLRATYTDEHPDVRRAQRELDTTKKELAHAEQLSAERTQAEQGAAALDDEVTRAAAARLEVVQQKIAAATGVRRRPSVPRFGAVAAIESPTDIEMRGVGQDTVLSGLLRRYEATRDVYEDLLKRQENARVSMDLDSEHRGLTLRVQEAAEVPVSSSSVRLLYIALGSLFLGLVVSLGLLVALLKLDARIRIPQQIEYLARMPLLVTIPSGEPPDGRSPQRTRWLLSASILAVVILFFAVTLLVNRQPS